MNSDKMNTKMLAKTADDFVTNKSPKWILNYKYQISAIIIFSAFTLLFIRNFIFSTGISIYRDWHIPVNPTLVANNLFYIWKDFGQALNLDALKRIPIDWLFTIFDSGTYQRIFLVLVLFLSMYAMFWLTFKFLENSEVEKKKRFYLGLFAGTLYVCNPIFVQVALQAYTGIAYAIYPLFLYFVYKSFESFNFNYYFLTALIITLEVALVIHYFLFTIPVIALFFILSILTNRNTPKLRASLKGVTVIALLTFLLSSYFVLPELSLIQAGENTQPTYALTTTMLQSFSHDTKIVNLLSLNPDLFWWPYTEYSLGPLVIFLWLLPLMAILSLLVVGKSDQQNKKRTLFFYFIFLSAIIYIFFAKGSNPPFGFIYSTINFNFPLVGWLFRVPEKFVYPVAAFFVVLATITVAASIKKNRVIGSLYIALLLLAGIITSWPILTGDLNHTLIGNNYSNINELNSYLLHQQGDFKVIWLPDDKFLPSTSKPAYSTGNPFFTEVMRLTKNDIFSMATALKAIGITNTKFILFTQNYKDNEASVSFLDKLNRHNSPLEKIGDEYIFQNTAVTNTFFIPSINIFSTNNLSSLDLITKIAVDLNKVAIYFLEASAQTESIKNYDLVDVSNTESLLLNAKKAVILTPYTATNNHNPAKVWSKGNTPAILHASFQYYLEEFNINNLNTDYGKGLVFTWANDSIQIPFNVDEQEPYVVLVRYFQNSAGGQIDFDLDGKPIAKLKTRGQVDKFFWKPIFETNLSAGQHSISIQNVSGLNAVNLIAIVPREELTKIEEGTTKLVEKKQLIYLLEAEKDFYYSGAQSDSNAILSYKPEDAKHVFTGKINVPDNATHASIQFWTKQNPNSQSTYSVNSIIMTPSCGNAVYSNDFEKKVELLALDSGLISKLDIFNPISGAYSFRIDSPEGTKKVWSVVSTDYLKIAEESWYTYTVSLKTNDANSVHSKVLYYNSDKNFISADFITGGITDEGVNSVSKELRAPIGATFMRLQFWSKPNREKASAYWVDDIEVKPSCPEIAFENQFELFENAHPEDQQLGQKGSSIEVTVKAGNANYWDVVKSKPFLVHSGLTYDFNIELSGDNTNELHAKIVFFYADINKSDKWGPEASNGTVLELNPKSEIFTPLDVLKNSNYMFAIRAGSNDNNASLSLKIGEETTKITMGSSHGKLAWFYTSKYLNRGSLEVRIVSDSNVDVDTVVIYSSDSNQTIESLFANSEKKAEIVSYIKVNPTLYKIRVKAEKPFMLSFAESYDPLWMAYTDDGFNSEPIPLYSVINGFWIDKTGEFDITIEYLPQRWFYYGLVLTILTIVGCAIYLIYDWKKGKGESPYRSNRRDIGEIDSMKDKIQNQLAKMPKLITKKIKREPKKTEQRKVNRWTYDKEK